MDTISFVQISLLMKNKAAILFSIKKNNERIIIKFTSRSFLQQQVRSMVGCIKFLGESKWKIDDFKKVFKSKKRSNCATPARPCGLYLTKISY